MKKHSLALSGMSRRQFLRYTALGSTAVFMAACAAPAAPSTGGGEAAPAEAPAAADAPAAAASGPKQGGTMTWMGHQEVAGLGPDNTGPTVQWVLIINIHNPLVTVNEFFELENVLAESVDVSDDGLTYTFKLHEGVKFHDGTEFTAEDVKYTYDFYRNPDNGMSIAGDFTGVDSVDAPDNYTVVVNMSDVNAASLTSWAGTPIVQSKYHAEVGEDTYRTAPIGTGPYKLKEWRPAEFTELEAFDDHFRGRPNIDTLRQDVVPEPSVRMIALQSGEADSAIWPLLVEDSVFLESDPGFVVYRTLANSIKHFPLNLTVPALADKTVRQAMMYALDRQRIIDDLWNGAAQISHSNLSPASPYHKADLPQYDYDPDKANAMLDEAGWAMGADGVREKDGVALTFNCTTITGDQARRPIAELAQQMFKEVGIDMQLEEAPVASILQSMREGTMDCSLYNWTYGTAIEPDPFSTLHSAGGNNFSQINNPHLDELIEAGLKVVDPAKREPIYHEIQEIFVDEVPALNLQFDEWMNVFNGRIQGLPENPRGGSEMYQQAYKWWIDES